MLSSRHEHPSAGNVPDGEKRTCVATGHLWSSSLKKAMLPDKEYVSSALVLGGDAGDADDSGDAGDAGDGGGETVGLMMARAPNRWAYEDAGTSSPHIVPIVHRIGLWGNTKGEYTRQSEEDQGVDHKSQKACRVQTALPAPGMLTGMMQFRAPWWEVLPEIDAAFYQRLFVRPLNCPRCPFAPLRGGDDPPETV